MQTMILYFIPFLTRSTMTPQALQHHNHIPLTRMERIAQYNCETALLHKREKKTTLNNVPSQQVRGWEDYVRDYYFNIGSRPIASHMGYHLWSDAARLMQQAYSLVTVDLFAKRMGRTKVTRYRLALAYVAEAIGYRYLRGLWVITGDLSANKYLDKFNLERLAFRQEFDRHADAAHFTNDPRAVLEIVLLFQHELLALCPWLEQVGNMQGAGLLHKACELEPHDKQFTLHPFKKNPGGKLSINDLNLIPTIPLSVELAARSVDLTLDQAKDRVCTALHEAAHLVAAIACPRSSIHYVWVHPKAKGKRGVGGEVRADECLPDEESLISLVGYAWEERHGNIVTAKGDYKRGFNFSYPDVLDTARTFIVSHDTLIRYAATGILCLGTAKGVLNGRRLKALVQWLRPHVTIFRSQDAKYPTGLQPVATTPGGIGAIM
jgi:hypothetical protein